MRDKKGREYASVAKTGSHDVLETDEGFTCMKAGEKKIVRLDTAGLFIDCAEGQHFLDGQLNNEGTHYIGLYPST